MLRPNAPRDMAWNPCSPLLPVWLLSGCIVPALRLQTSQQRDTVHLDFVCEWQPRPPITKRVIVDLSLHAGQFNRTPNADDIRAVEAAGGRVLYRFRVALLRAELDTAAVRALVAGSTHKSHSRPGETAVAEVKILILRGSLNDVLRRA